MKYLTILVTLIFILISLQSCEREDEMYIVGNEAGPQIDDIIKYQAVSTGNVEADGVSLHYAIVQIHKEADASNRTISFHVSGEARFTNGDTVLSVPANADGSARVDFYSTKAEQVHLKASILTFSIQQTVNFTPALPHDLIVSADQYVIDTFESVNITVQLYRDPGKGTITEPVKVSFNVEAESTDAAELAYPPFAYSENGEAAVTLLNPLKGTGVYSITASVSGADGSTISRSIKVTIQKSEVAEEPEALSAILITGAKPALLL